MVVKHYYREISFRIELTAPYQILMDCCGLLCACDKIFIYAPEDTDTCIKSLKTSHPKKTLRMARRTSRSPLEHSTNDVDVAALANEIRKRLVGHRDILLWFESISLRKIYALYMQFIRPRKKLAKVQRLSVVDIAIEFVHFIGFETIDQLKERAKKNHFDAVFQLGDCYLCQLKMSPENQNWNTACSYYEQAAVLCSQTVKSSGEVYFTFYWVGGWVG